MSHKAATQVRHDELVEATANRLQGEGYEVTLDPSGRRLGLNSEFRPDLVARRGDETIVVEVASRRSLKDQDGLREFAREVDALPGWRFELVLSETLDEPDEVHNLDSRLVQRRLDEVQQLSDIGHWEAALLLVSSALEAALRNAAAARGVALGRVPTREVLRTAVSLGYIDDAALAELDWMWRVRNDVAHGVAPTGQTAQQLPQITRFLADLSRQVLSDVRDAVAAEP